MKFNLAEYLEELRPLINVDCGTYTIEGIEYIANQFEQKFQAMAGWYVKRVDCAKAGIGLEIRNKPDTEQIDVMLVGHLDTVFAKGTAAQRPMYYDDEKAYGPGVADMKSGLLNIVYALRHLEPALTDKCSICVCMNPDEEVGSADSVVWLQSVAKHAKYALVVEAARADGGLVKARKGRACYQLNFHGVAAHAGNEPQNGRSAITELAHWIVAINGMTNFDSGTTLNVGVMSGGTNSNTVAEYADAAIEVRFWNNEEYQHVDAVLKRMQVNPFIDGVSVVLEREVYKPAMMPSKRTESLMKLVETLAQELEINIKWHSAGGGSDANHMAILGVPTIDGLGAIGGHFHSDKEYLLLESIEPRIRLLMRILQQLAS